MTAPGEISGRFSADDLCRGILLATGLASRVWGGLAGGFRLELPARMD